MAWLTNRFPVVSQAEFLAKAKALQSAWEEQFDRVAKKKLRALEALKTKPRIADQEGFGHWKYPILMLKLAQLEQVETAAEIDEILVEVKDDGKRVKIPLRSRYWLIEEEALFWSAKSLEAPLAHEAFDRYTQVFAELCEKYRMENPLRS